MKLLRELNEDVQCIVEAKEGEKKKYFIEGVIMQAELKNRNGRVYSRDVLENELNRYIKECVNEDRAVGELGHPKDGGPQINLKEVSHKFEWLKMDGNNVVGRARILDTPNGLTVQGLLSGGVKIGVSSRGLGSLKENNGIMEVQKDFRLVTAADIVADPSAPEAFVRGIAEDVEYYFDAVTGTYQRGKLEEMKKQIHSMSRREREEKMLSLFESFLNTLSSK